MKFCSPSLDILKKNLSILRGKYHDSLAKEKPDVNEKKLQYETAIKALEDGVAAAQVADHQAGLRIGVIAPEAVGNVGNLDLNEPPADDIADGLGANQLLDNLAEADH